MLLLPRVSHIRPGIGPTVGAAHRFDRALWRAVAGAQRGCDRRPDEQQGTCLENPDCAAEGTSATVIVQVSATAVAWSERHGPRLTRTVATSFDRTRLRADPNPMLTGTAAGERSARMTAGLGIAIAGHSFRGRFTPIRWRCLRPVSRALKRQLD